MPTIPLYTSPTHPDDSHHVRAPGGYEWWYFDAEDSDADRQIFLIVFDGCPFDPRYARAYHRYIRNPTRVPPPVPASFPLTYFAMHQAGNVVQQVIDRSPLPVDRGRAPVCFARERLEIQLNFTPRWSHRAVEKALAADHRWVVGNVLCDVEGTIRVAKETFRFSGRGYRDHCWGTTAPSASIRSWTFGRQFHGNSVLAFHRLRLCEGVGETVAVEISESGISEPATESILSRFRDPFARRAGFYRRQVNDGMRNSVVHTVFPHLLAWPFVSEVIERTASWGLSRGSRAPSS